MTLAQNIARFIQMLSASAWLLACSASAEIVIYNQSITDIATGNDDIKNRTYTGWLVFDTNTHEMQDLLARKLNTSRTPKAFFQIGTNADVHLLSPAANKFTLWAVVPAYDTGGVTFKGAAPLITLGTPNQFYVPRTMTVRGACFEIGGETVHEFTGVVTLNSKATATANQAGQDVDTVIENLKAALIAKGYTEL